jgi:hypothetical protein
MKLATIEFHQLEVLQEANETGNPRTYIECRLVDPPVDFAVGYGANLSEAFTDMRARVLDSAIYSARLLHDDPEEWGRRAGTGGSDTGTESGTDDDTGTESE